MALALKAGHFRDGSFATVATRYDQLAANYPAFIKLASIRIWLCGNESTPWARLV